MCRYQVFFALFSFLFCSSVFAQNSAYSGQLSCTSDAPYCVRTGRLIRTSHGRALEEITEFRIDGKWYDMTNDGSWQDLTDTSFVLLTSEPDGTHLTQGIHLAVNSYPYTYSSFSTPHLIGQIDNVGPNTWLGFERDLSLAAGTSIHVQDSMGPDKTTCEDVSMGLWRNASIKQFHTNVFTIHVIQDNNELATMSKSEVDSTPFASHPVYFKSCEGAGY